MTREDEAYLLGYPPGSFDRIGYGPTPEAINRYRASRCFVHALDVVLRSIGAEVPIPRPPRDGWEMVPVKFDASIFDRPFFEWMKKDR